MSHRRLILFFLLVVALACGKDDEPKPGPTAYRFPDILYYPKSLNIPLDNPTTNEGVLLGRHLFYDGRLSGRTHPDSLMSCASCHLQRNGFDVGRDHPKFTNGRPYGLTGIPTPHFPLPLVNLVYNKNGYLWNGFIHERNPLLGSTVYGLDADPQYHMRNIESLVWMSIVAPHEMNGSVERSVQMISEIQEYRPMFEAAFGSDEVNLDRISKAIAQFVRTIISYRSKYHQYLEGVAMLSESEMRGMELFFSEDADCFHCHGGYLMTTNEYFNNAKDSVFVDPRDRYAVTGDNMDRGAYKAPSLINIELTGPYMHDGRFKTLEEVVNFYSEGLVKSPYVHPLMKYIYTDGVQMTNQEKEDLIAFLKTLTDQELLTDERFSKPGDMDY